MEMKPRSKRHRPHQGWLKSWAFLEARRLLDLAYQEFYNDQTKSTDDARQPTSLSTQQSAQLLHPPSPSPAPPASPEQPTHHALRAIPSPPSLRSPSPALSDALTEHLLPDIPTHTPDFPLHSAPASPRPPSPADSTSSVEILEEFPPPPSQRNRFPIYPGDTFDSVINRFDRTTDPLPQGTYTIGPDYFDPEEIRAAIAEQPPGTHIPVFIPSSPFPYLVPIDLFNDLFPPSIIIIKEIQ
ncbi:extensin-like [Mycetomoellerius zeteki]|uniref:extensin-like n=1 Tax=Mycetomoellerius zeteki TaxID=64791 RepID=UPI00084E49EC|nr:PREDICTED: extensin-like [Trachymyrmex zeteki]